MIPILWGKGLEIQDYKCTTSLLEKIICNWARQLCKFSIWLQLFWGPHHCSFLLPSPIFPRSQAKRRSWISSIEDYKQWHRASARTSNSSQQFLVSKHLTQTFLLKPNETFSFFFFLKESTLFHTTIDHVFYYDSGTIVQFTFLA